MQAAQHIRPVDTSELQPSHCFSWRWQLFNACHPHLLPLLKHGGVIHDKISHQALQEGQLALANSPEFPILNQQATHPRNYFTLETNFRQGDLKALWSRVRPFLPVSKMSLL